MSTDVERRLAILEAVLGIEDNGSCQGDVFFCLCEVNCPVTTSDFHKVKSSLSVVLEEINKLRGWVDEAEKWGFIPSEIRTLARLRERRQYLSAQIEDFQSTQLRVGESPILTAFLKNFRLKLEGVDEEIRSLTKYLEFSYVR